MLEEDQEVLDVVNVVWFTPDCSWIDLPVFGETEPIHHRGIVDNEPGLYFVGLHFLYAMSSGFLPGVGRDAEYVVESIASRHCPTPCATRTPDEGFHRYRLLTCWAASVEVS